MEMAQLKQAMSSINTGDENTGPTQSFGEACVPVGISEHLTRAVDNSRRERLKELRSQCLTDLEYEIESSQEHWTEVETEATSDDEELEAANREVFERLMEQWRCPKTGLCFFHDWGENLQVGRKITEGGQAEIFEAKIEDDPGYVVKAFKKGYNLKDLERQWPRGMFQSPLKDLERQWPRGMFQSQPLDSSRSSVKSWLSSVRSWLSSVRNPIILKAQRSEDKANQASVSTHFIYNNCCFIHGATLLRNGRFAFVLERYWGDLRRYIDLRMEAGHGKPFRGSRADLYIMREIAKGMFRLHRRGILHRDLKASNILVRKLNGDLDGDLHKYSSGLKLSKFVVDVADFESSSATVGTGFWRAPEVLSALKDRTSMRDATPWTEKSDVYAYAMTCYEVLTGRLPFEGVDGINHDRVINGARPPWFDNRRLGYDRQGPRCDDDLVILVMKCWHTDPSIRPNFRQIVEVLDRKRRSEYEGRIPAPDIDSCRV